MLDNIANYLQTSPKTNKSTILFYNKYSEQMLPKLKTTITIKEKKNDRTYDSNLPEKKQNISSQQQIKIMQPASLKWIKTRREIVKEFHNINGINRHSNACTDEQQSDAVESA